MSLVQEIVAIVERDGRATVPKLAAMFPAYTYLQVKQATYNAVFRGLLVRIERGKGLGFAKGSTHSVYGPATKAHAPYQPVQGLVSSVWDLAQA